MSYTSYSFKDNIVINDSKWLRWLNNTGTTRANILGVESNNVHLKSANENLYINSDSNSYTYINKNNSNNVLVGSKLAVGIESTSNLTADIAIKNAGYIGTNTNNSYITFSGSYSNSNAEGGLISIYGNSNLKNGQIDIIAGNHANGHLNFYTGDNSLKMQIMNSGMTNFSPNGVNIRLSVSDNETVLTNTMKITNTTDAQNITSGALQVLGGMSITKSLYVGESLITGSLVYGTISYGNLYANNLNIGTSKTVSGSFSASNNVSSPSSITDLSFNSNNIRSFTGNMSIAVVRSSGGNLYENITIDGHYTESEGWTIYTSSVGDITGVSLSITSMGQLRYTSTNIANWTSTTFRYVITFISMTNNYEGINLTTGTFIANTLELNDTTNAVLNVQNGSFYTPGGGTFEKDLIVKGDINFVGDLYNNGVLFSGETTWRTGGSYNIFYTSGNVGIKNTDPQYELDVSGNINFTGDIYQNGTLFVSGTDLSSGGASVGGHLIPASDISYDLGSTSNKWRDLYLSGSTIYLDNETISVNTAGNFEFSSNTLKLGGETLTMSGGSISIGALSTTTTFGNNINIVYNNPNFSYNSVNSEFNIQSYNINTYDGWIAKSGKLYFTGSDFGGMTSNSSGSYVASASSFLGNYDEYAAYKAFNLNKDDFWHSEDAYDFNTGAYIGNISTTANGVVYSGEWLQIQYPEPILLTNFKITPRSENYQNRSPKSFVVLGSNNGSNWNLLHEETNYTSWLPDTSFTFNTPSISQSYSYYRLVTRIVGFENVDRTSVQINEWELNPTYSSKTYKIRVSGTINGFIYSNTPSNTFELRLLDESDNLVQTLYTSPPIALSGYIDYVVNTGFIEITPLPEYRIQLYMSNLDASFYLFGGFRQDTQIEINKQIYVDVYPKTDLIGSLNATFNSNTIGSLITTGGNVGIGTTDPLHKLHVDGDIFATGKVIAFSDERLKTDINLIDDALNKVSSLRGVEYKMINTNEKNIGVIAQDVEKVYPELVVSKDNNYKGVCYGNMVGLLIEAIKELNEKIKELERK